MIIKKITRKPKHFRYFFFQNLIETPSILPSQKYIVRSNGHMLFLYTHTHTFSHLLTIDNPEKV